MSSRSTQRTRNDVLGPGTVAGTEEKGIASDPCYRDYGWHTAAPTHMHCRYLPKVLALCGDCRQGARVLDVGCGNGYLAGEFLKKGFEVVGIDLSRQGIEIARAAFPAGRFEVLGADEHTLRNLGCEPFDVVISTEVVEHLYDPRSFARGCFAALRPAGRFICSTPYHGYFKNLTLALLNHWDVHANPLWDGGHIKLWSKRTLTRLLTEVGFVNLRFVGVGRAPLLWMTMVMSGDRPVD